MQWRGYRCLVPMVADVIDLGRVATKQNRKPARRKRRPPI